MAIKSQPADPLSESARGFMPRNKVAVSESLSEAGFFLIRAITCLPTGPAYPGNRPARCGTQRWTAGRPWVTLSLNDPH
jgi:hypothetical protein